MTVGHFLVVCREVGAHRHWCKAMTAKTSYGQTAGPQQGLFSRIEVGADSCL